MLSLFTKLLLRHVTFLLVCWMLPLRGGAGTTLDAETSANAVAGRVWYLRPMSTSVTYGREDGTSYANAFNGLTAAGRSGKGPIWGTNGIQAGDTLYICGSHWLPIKQPSQSFYHGRIAIPIQGLSEQQQVTIRSDAPEEAGVIWGYGRNSSLADQWTGPDANGVYRIDRDLGDYIAEDIAQGRGRVYLNKKTTITWTGENAAFCRDGGATYVKTSDGKSPAGRLYTGDIAYRFALLRNQYITFKNLTFNGFVFDIDRDENGELVTTLPRSSHITFDGCSVRYGSQTFFKLYDGNNNWRFAGCLMEYAPSAVNTLGNMGGEGASYLTVSHCTIRNLGVLMFPHQDAHGVGIRRGHDNLIEGNYIENTGTAVEFWTIVGAPMRNMTVRYNFIKNTKAKANTTGSGISISGENGDTLGERTGYNIYGNIISSVDGDGITSNNKDPITLLNNVISNADNGIRLEVTNGAGVRATVLNNVVLNPRSNFVEVGGVGNQLTWDYNLYYSSLGASAPLWKHWGSFQAWRNEMRVDSHSLFAVPQFVTSNPVEPADFKLKSGSPAIDAGTDVGLKSDFIGSTVPANGRPDIGAYEFGSGIRSGTVNWMAYQ